MERLKFQSAERGFVPGLLPTVTLQEQRVTTKRKSSSLLNVIYRVKSFKHHKIRHDQKLAIFCLKDLHFQGTIFKFRVKASAN